MSTAVAATFCWREPHFTEILAGPVKCAFWGRQRHLWHWALGLRPNKKNDSKTSNQQLFLLAEVMEVNRPEECDKMSICLRLNVS